jgi:hypothetical protein
MEAEVGLSDGSATITSDPMTAATGHLYLARVYIDRAGGAPAVSSVAGLGLTWSLVKAQCSGQNEHRVEAWKAIGAPSADGAVAVTLAAAADSAYMVVERWAGVKVSAPVGAISGYNTNGSGGACSGGADNADATGSITTTAGGSVVSAAFVTDEDFSHTAGWTSRVTNATTGLATVKASLEDKAVAVAGATTVGGAGNLIGVDDWALVAVEIVAAPRPIAPRTLARFYDPATSRPLRDIVAWQ